MPKISIVVPVYNASAYLARCLSSLAAQSFEDIEVIAVDDGSVDDSWAIIQNVAQQDPRFARSVSRPHSGLGPSRNQGYELATGDFVAFVDADDYVDPDYCGAPYTIALKHRAEVVMFGSWWESPDSSVIHHPYLKAGMSPQKALLRATSVVWDKLYRRDFLQRCSLCFPSIYHEDEVVTPILMSHEPRIAVLDRPLYHYIRREGSICGLKINPKSADLLRAFEMVIDQSRRVPRFRDALEYYAVRSLRSVASSWAACDELWAQDCLVKANRLLGSIDHPGSANSYLIRDREPKRSNALLPRLGRSIKKRWIECLNLVSKIHA